MIRHNFERLSGGLASVVTPFFNTEAYLAECIESILQQTYSDWEYILVNNCSTDKSREIALSYARKDPRIRLVDNETFLPQVANYNHALRQISTESKYCKIVEADNWIFPECLSRMIDLADRNPSVGIVSAYNITEKSVRYGGLFYGNEVLKGREICRIQLMHDLLFFGAPTTVLFRSDVVRSRDPFYDEKSTYHEDVRACYDFLQTWDFGFVHQILTFVRMENDSIGKQGRNYNDIELDRLIAMSKYGRIYLEGSEFERSSHRVRTDYFTCMTKHLTTNSNKAFWKYHRDGLASIGLDSSILRLKLYICCMAGLSAYNRFRKVILKVVGYFRHTLGHKTRCEATRDGYIR